MNRIYQGRVTRADIIDGKGVVVSASDWNWEAALWDHHVLFQDAVNYYVVCLLALAQPGSPVYSIREKLDAHNGTEPDERMVWRPFRRRGALRTGLRDSVAKYLTPDKPTPTPDECFAAVLAGNECNTTEAGRKILDAGLTQLLQKCTGESGCRNSSKEFLPRFTAPDYLGSYGEDTTTLVRENQMARFPFVLHSGTRSALQEFGVHSIALPNEKKPKFVGPEAMEKLASMIHEWRVRMPEADAEWKRLDSLVSRLPADLEIPGYAPTSAKNERKFQLFAMFLFRYVEASDFVLRLLRETTRKPSPKEAPPLAVEAAFAAADPIRRARGERGYVFRAFTRLPCWDGDNMGKPGWVQFDFAAFCEALKALHQVQAKTEERATQREQKEAQHQYQRGRAKQWKAAAHAEEGAPPPILTGDPRIERLQHLVDVDLRDEYEMSEGVSVKYGLHPRTIRGFRDLRKIWREEVKDHPYTPSGRDRLRQSLRKFQEQNPNIVGSVRLFEALAEEANWIIWREPTADQLQAWRTAAKLPVTAEFAPDPLQALTDERELLEEIERLSDPIRFTPAHPEYSRRQFYFSDVSAIDKKNRFRHDRQLLETEIAVERAGKWSRQWVRIAFTAPRLLRDQLNNTGGADAAWQQAMMAALGLRTGLLKNGKPAGFADCAAVALMPEMRSSGSKRLLLNFPITLHGEGIAAQLGKAARWDDLQFGGAGGESYWLRWPDTWIDEKKPRKKTPPIAWWRSSKPFQILSVDLGQRDAGAYAVIDAAPGKPPKPQSRRLGAADGTSWWATVRSTGMLRLPGEDAKVMRDGSWQEELSGSRGRMATDGEWLEAADICARLGFAADKILGTDRRRHSFPELNRELLFVLRSAQSRLARLQSWSCIAHDDTKAARRAAIVQQIADADEDPLGLKPLAEKQQWAEIATALCSVIEQERQAIQDQLVRIADRIQPLRGRRWEWARRSDDPKNHILRQTEHGSDARPKLLAGQRGLSLQRVEQLESLRQRCQSLNRTLMQAPGVPAKLGRSKRGLELPDPCPELLDRLEALKEQRVNQTAHLILAQALGVRLKAHATNEAQRRARDVHGEYERIPGREPVDFVVLENLDRYLATQGRSRSENSRLMKWSHRAILGKLKQLCEPYGLRVLEAPAAYSSKFSSLTGIAGFRAVELTPDDANEFPWKRHFDRLSDPERLAKLPTSDRTESECVKALFDALTKLNQALIEERDRARAGYLPFRPKWRTLLAPQQLGPIFVPMRGHPMQADINAAINIGLRAIASPEADDIHVRVRAQRDGATFVVRAENVREAARWRDGIPTIDLPKDADAKAASDRKKLLAESRVNFFFDFGSVADFDHAVIENVSPALASGRGLWGTVNREAWLRTGNLNNDRLEKAGLGRPLVESTNF